MAESRELWVFSEKPALLAELIAAGQALAKSIDARVVAVVYGARTQLAQVFAAGVETLIWLGEAQPGTSIEDCVPSLAQLAEQRRPAAILIGATLRGKAVAGRLAARLDRTVITDVKQLESVDGAIQARHMIFGGGAVRTERTRVEPVLVTIAQGTFAALIPQPGRSGEVIEAPFIEPERRATLRERKARPPKTVNLAAAKRVVCPGRGVARQEDLGMIEELARALSAEVGCTRPLAEGLDWLPRERYIGISGANIRPDLYLGVGVSGQVQHMVGMAGSRVVVAINKDEHAPIFTKADYGVVGDLYAIVPALIAALKNRK